MTSRSTDVVGSSQHPSSSRSHKVPAVFLSHSGKQKPFVERLNETLRRVNHSPFFDMHSLRKGDPFPEKIKTAARECTLGVVVLSEDFVTSKWPMIELEILVQQRAPNAKLLPLFYKLVPEDLKSSEKLNKWHKKWAEMIGDEEESVKKWDTALKALRCLNGEIYVEGTSEAEYIKRVVKSICTQVPCPLPYDMSEIVGHKRLAQEVAWKFKRMCRAWQVGAACMVGLHGVGGLGKSTICKIMANFYGSEYPGKCHHLELSIKGCDMGIIVEKCKQALRVLADLDDDYLKRVHDFDQVIELMKEHLTSHDVFLAIDNVWESSRTAVGRIVKVGFSAESRILVTSRSQDLLKELLRNQKNSCVDPLPAPNLVEASQIFVNAFELGDLNSLAKGRKFVYDILQRCKYGGTYHALALKAHGMYVKHACPLGGWQHLKEEDLSGILQDIENADLTSVDDVIRLTYDSLRENLKHAFLDIALLPTMRCRNGQLTYEKARQWLSILYKKQFPEVMIKELCLGGLLQLETVRGTGVTFIRVHDLISDIAEKAAARDSRFFIAGKSSRVLEEIQWQELERVILKDCSDKVGTPQVIKKLQQQECQRLQVLDAREVVFSQGIDMHRMPALCVLKLRDVYLRSIQNWSASALGFVHLDNVHFIKATYCPQQISLHFAVLVKQLKQTSPKIEIEELTDPGILQMFQCLDEEARQSQESVGLGILEGTLQPNQSPQSLACPSLEIIPDGSVMSGNEFIPGREIGRIAGLTCLQSLTIAACKALKEADISGLTLLRTINISFCSSLERVSDLSRLTHLDSLRLVCCGSLKELGGLSSTLTVIHICLCRALKKVPDISGLTRLKMLILLYNDELEEVEGRTVSSILTHLRIAFCWSLRQYPRQLKDFRNWMMLDL